MDSNENINNNSDHLIELSGSDYEIADGQPDVTGWDVIDVQGGKIGEVDELIFDPELRKVRYLVVDMEDNDLDLEVERKVLVPIGIAELNTQDDNVILPNVSVQQLSDLPPYESDSITPDTETAVRNVFNENTANELGFSADDYNRTEFYDHNHFDDAKFYGSRDSRIADESLPFANENTGYINDATTENLPDTGTSYPKDNLRTTDNLFDEDDNDRNNPPRV